MRDATWTFSPRQSSAFHTSLKPGFFSSSDNIRCVEDGDDDADPLRARRQNITRIFLIEAAGSKVSSTLSKKVDIVQIRAGAGSKPEKCINPA